jgi:hypothetical protein
MPRGRGAVGVGLRVDATAPAAPVGAHGHARARARIHVHRREPLYIRPNLAYFFLPLKTHDKPQIVYKKALCTICVRASAVPPRRDRRTSRTHDGQPREKSIKFSDGHRKLMLVELYVGGEAETKIEQCWTKFVIMSW